MKTTSSTHHPKSDDQGEAENRQAYNPPVRREKKASRAVLIADAVADRAITIGGILVIIAVLGILVFLVMETLPLFRGGIVTDKHAYRLEIPSAHTLGVGMDDYKTIAYTVSKDGSLQIFHAKTGIRLQAPSLDLQKKMVSSYAATFDRRHLAFGFTDGAVQFASLQFPSEILPADEIPQGLKKLDDRDSTDGSSVYSRIPGNQFRKISFQIALEDPLKAFDDEEAVVALGYRLSGEAERQTRAFVAVNSRGGATLNVVQSKMNLLTGKRRIRVKKTHLPPLPKGTRIHSVLLTEKADIVFIADRSGKAFRYNTLDFDSPLLAEISPLLPKGTELTAFGFLLGGQSIVVGGSDCSLNIYFLLEREGIGTQDGRALQLTRRFENTSSPVVRFDASIRDKSFAVADAGGALRVLHGTSQKNLVKLNTGLSKAAYLNILLAPRLDGLMALRNDGQVQLWEFSVPHPETTFRTLFQKVWYEGYPAPTYTWQSSAATDDYESKFSLIPLIFGTIKAAFYSLLFAIPIAILGAIYTSEFVHYRVRAFVKPTMELMASLPSVVLGFVAALVLAPLVDTWISAVILAFVIFPIGLMLAAYLWQLIPLRISIRLQGIPKFSLISLVVVLSLLAAYRLGPWFEDFFFQGDFKAWVNGDVGTAEPLLFLLGLPVSFIIVTSLASRLLGRAMADYVIRLNRFQAAIFDMGRWLAIVGATVLCSYVVAKLLALIGVDVRGGFVDTYVQRNTLVVGFAMGFAVIPIIYTIAEDALNAVPEHLRAASLGCGATPWQTAIYVVMPTAISGVFSAIMIGMGRAVGETMIVVMSAGNTPLLDWNIFNGLRALSATIAVELPEAVKDGTLYRILFLSGLVLFAMTFVINTVAELIRLRFRKRARQL